MNRYEIQEKVEASKVKYICVFLLYLVINMLIAKVFTENIGALIFKYLDVSIISIFLATLTDIFFLLLVFYAVFLCFGDIKISKVFPYYAAYIAFAILINLSIGLENVASDFLETYIVVIIIESVALIMLVEKFSKRIGRW